MTPKFDNLHRFEHLSPTLKAALELRAITQMNKYHVLFKIMKVTDHEIIIQTSQLQKLENESNIKELLVKVTEDVFSPFLYGRRLRIGIKLFIPTNTDIVDAQWILDKMAQQKLKFEDLERILGIEKYTLSVYTSGKHKLNRAEKGLFFYFFNYRNLVIQIKASIKNRENKKEEEFQQNQ
jgi:hypothetical protein